MATETRRDILRHLALGLGVLSCRAAFGQPAEEAAYVGIETSAATGTSTASFFTASGARAGSVPLDFRAHGLTEHGQRLVVFPRRPGNRFAVLDADTLAITAVVTAPEGRHFYGHGAFTADGTRLLVTENDLETLSGAIGVYELSPTPRRLGQIALPGPGPHEIVREPGRDRFLIALGGLETHPDYGRTVLNLSDFRSQLIRLDLVTGTVEPMGFWAGTEGVSLRHLAADGRGRAYVGGQIADPARAGTEASIVWMIDDTGPHALPDAGRLGGYVSSVAAADGRALMSSKETGAVLTLEGDRIVAETRLDGASALATHKGLSVTGGYDRLLINLAEARVMPGCEFDNHGLAL